MSICPQVVERNCNCFIPIKTLLHGKSYPAYRGNSVLYVTGTVPAYKTTETGTLIFFNFKTY